MTIFSVPQPINAEGTDFSPAEAYIEWMRNDLASGGWQADPTQPCLLYKVYNSVERIPLDTHIPLRLGMSYTDTLQPARHLSLSARPETLLSCLLYYTHGLTRILRPEAGVSSLHSLAKNNGERKDTYPRRFAGPSARSSPFLGRPVPSGGSLHPVEIYLALGTDWHIPAGIYHYDSTHHALERLREGDFTAAIAECLAEKKLRGPGSLTIFPTICFQKNHQKYTNLSYWLQTLDAGILIEQLRFVARCLDLPLATSLRYLDQPLHHLLGLDTSEENIYAVLCLQAPLAAQQTQREHHRLQALAALPSLTVAHCQPFVPHKQSSLLNRLYAASLISQAENLADMAASYQRQNSIEDEQALALPASLPTSQEDIVQTLLHRRTGMSALASDPLRITELAAMLAPLRENENSLLEDYHFQLYCVVSRVDTLLPGVYLYQKHAFVPIHQTNILPILSRISTGINIFPHLAPINLFLCADYQQALKLHGVRGLRMLGIELGRILQQLSLAAAASNLATHIHQSFHLEGTRKVLLRLPSPSQLPLASMMVGHAKSLQGGLFEAIWY
ncbi:MAG TPA: SagB family peptide dehydrogenase [Ktedonobacteraceae bacterium]|nr:SagB family peptide dehydrogenase [Ktedonobacteraceae bacterium]